jgi:hypothetical protein
LNLYEHVFLYFDVMCQYKDEHDQY